MRVEDYLFEKLDKKRDRLNNTELLGQDMIDAGTDFGPGTSYGTNNFLCFFCFVFLLCTANCKKVKVSQLLLAVANGPFLLCVCVFLCCLFL